jgi:hypothetical protein
LLSVLPRYEHISADLSIADMIWEQFTAKQLNRQAAKASKDEKTEKDKLKKVGPSLSSPLLRSL